MKLTLRMLPSFPLSTKELIRVEAHLEDVAQFPVVDKRVDHAAEDEEGERKSGADESGSDGADDEEEDVLWTSESEQTREAHHRSRRRRRFLSEIAYVVIGAYTHHLTHIVDPTIAHVHCTPLK